MTKVPFLKQTEPAANATPTPSAQSLPAMTGPGLLLVLLMIINTKTSKAFRQDEECVRIREEIQIYKEDTSLGFLQTMRNEIAVLHSKNLINLETRGTIEAELEEMTHNWCRISKKRSIAGGIFTAIFTIGMYIIGPAVANVFNLEKNDSSEKWQTYLSRIGNITKINTDLINDLEKRIQNIELKQRADEEVTAIISAAVLHNSLYRELIHKGSKFDVIMEKIFHHSIEHYKNLSLIEEQNTSDIEEDFPLPEKAFKLSIEVRKSQSRNCNETHIRIVGVAALPSKQCYNIIEHSTEHTKLAGPTEGRCLWTSPLKYACDLNDGSKFAMANFVEGDCDDNSYDWLYEDTTMTLMARPRRRGTMIVSCGSNKTSKIHRLYRDQLYAAPASCSALISNTKIPTKQDFVQRESHYISNHGERLFAGSANTNKDDTIIWRPFLPYYTNIHAKATELKTNFNNTTAKIDQVRKEEENIKDPYTKTDRNTNGNQAMVLSITIIGLILSIYIAWRVIRNLRKRQQKTNYNFELKRRSITEEMGDYWGEDRLEVTDDNNTQRPRKENKDKDDNKVTDTICKAGDADPDKYTEIVDDRTRMLTQLKEKTVARKMKLDNLRQQR